MSSHHFVREGQEPALFIAEAFSFGRVASLLEWAPLVMVVDSALDSVLSWGIKIDVVLAQTTQLEAVEEKTYLQRPLQIIPYDQDQNPVFVGLDNLISHQEAVNIISKISDRTFEQMQAYLGKVNLVLFDDEMRWVPVGSKKFEKWLPTKSRIAIRRDGAQAFEFNGLVQLDADSYESVTDGKITIASTDLFWVGEKIA
jgi:hypothetical protein